MSEFHNYFKSVSGISDKKIILGGDFNLFYDSIAKADVGTPTIKKGYLCKIHRNHKNHWFMRYLENSKPQTKQFTFHQKRFSWLIQRKFDYVFVSDILQESAKNTDILASFSSDHLPDSAASKNDNTISRDNR